MNSAREEVVANLALVHAYAMRVIQAMLAQKQQVLSPQVIQLQVGLWM
jgi:hypothetical protein